MAFLIKRANPGLFFIYFRLCKHTLQYFTTNNYEKSLSSIWCRDLNSRPLEHESLPITIRPGLPQVLKRNSRPIELKIIISVFSLLIEKDCLSWQHGDTLEWHWSWSWVWNVFFNGPFSGSFYLFSVFSNNCTILQKMPNLVCDAGYRTHNLLIISLRYFH